MANKYMLSQGAGNPKTIEMGGDMSDNRQCDEDIYLGGKGIFGFTASWPAESDAVGAFVVEENGGNTEATWEPIPQMAWAEVVALQPGGLSADGVLSIKNIKTTAARIRVRYVRTSGGADVPMLVEVF